MQGVKYGLEEKKMSKSKTSCFYLYFLLMLELKYRVEKISKIKRVEDELFLLIFFLSTRSLTNL